MNRNIRTFAIAQTVDAAIVLGALLLLPGADTATTMAAMLAVWGITASVYRITPYRDTAGWWTLLVATTFLAVGVIANTHYFTEVSGGTTSDPVLNNCDSRGYFLDALHHSGMDKGVPESATRRGYGLLISSLWKITGITIVSPLVLNMLMILLTIIISGGITYRLSGGKGCGTTHGKASLAMIMTASVCYFLNSGTVLLKEAGISLAMSLIALGLTSTIAGDSPIRAKERIPYTIAFIAGLALLGVFRHTFILIATLGTILLMRWNNPPRLKQSFLFLALGAAAWGIMTLLTRSDISGIAGGVVDGAAVQSSFFYDNDQHRFYNNLVGDYLQLPAWKRILMLPMSAVTQFLVPFPWNFSRDITFGYTLAYAHIAYPWYIIGGIILFFIFTGWRTAPSRLRRFVVTGVILWLVPAYLFAGTVSRYALPMLPMLIPAAVHVITTCRNSKPFRIWGLCYTALIAVTLIVCHYLQQSATVS